MSYPDTDELAFEDAILPSEPEVLVDIVPKDRPNDGTFSNAVELRPLLDAFVSATDRAPEEGMLLSYCLASTLSPPDTA